MTMRYVYGRMLEEQLQPGRGIPRRRLPALAARFGEVRAEVAARRAAGEYGFLALGEQGETLRAIRAYAEGVGQAFSHVVVLGIGGSALGMRALLTALRPPAWNELDLEARDGFPTLTILENVDPVTIAATLRRLDPRRTLVNVISKSGGTAETLAQYLVVRRWLEDAVGEHAPRHFVFTTDPARGALRELGTREGIPLFDVPPPVGGRFSVLTAVGLVPAALVGLDIDALVRGAATALRRGEEPDLLRNPAALYAALHHEADHAHGAPIHVLMPYCDRLRDLAEWLRQLWAESLGKRVDRAGRVVHTGPTPVGALGATDQHSQVQLFMEGPFDKVITLVGVEHPGVDVRIPGDPAALPPDLAYLPGHTLGALLTAERDATSAALARMGRMHGLLRLPQVDAETVGELLMFFQLATGFAGVFYGIDPFDQPGVELGKRLTFAAMGRPGYAPEPDAGEPLEEA
ncbi:MAG: glucose-6-phosphate isomerase [Gemmatimonadales bacterium]|nr:glucose-6-phosphate isomerase [Gemmatimonadales bacterium]